MLKKHQWYLCNTFSQNAAFLCNDNSLRNSTASKRISGGNYRTRTCDPMRVKQEVIIISSFLLFASLISLDDIRNRIKFNLSVFTAIQEGN